MNNDTISHVTARIKEFQAQLARMPGKFASRRRHPTFTKDPDKIRSWSRRWRDTFFVHGCSRPPSLLATNTGLQLRMIDMNEQHQRWYMKKFGKLDPNVMTIADCC